MAFFSFSLLGDTLTYLPFQIKPNQKYYSKDITLWNELNNRNKKKQICLVKHENRLRATNIGKKLLICLPPKFGLGDAIEYSIAIRSLIKSKKFTKIGIAFCSNHLFVFKKLFLFSNIYPLLISDKQIRAYDTVFHVTLEVEALKFQKYKRSNITSEICKYNEVGVLDYKNKNIKKLQNYEQTISIFPVSTSIIRSLPYNVIEEITKNFQDKYQVKTYIDDSPFSRHLEEQNFNGNISFVKPKNIENLILEISKIKFGVFVDSGPLHVAKIFDKQGVLIETSVKNEILLSNSKTIYTVLNKYSSNYCKGPCGLVDIFSFDNNIGCYETNKLSFEEIKHLKSFKSLQRWNKKDNNTYFILNPVGCVKKIDVKKIIKLINDKIKEY